MTPALHRITPLARIAQSFELGAHGSPLACAAAALWGALARRGIARPLALPSAARVIGVGGATLGGSGKTGTAVALARALALALPGERVAFVGHAYRAQPGRARVVTASDLVREVGDDACFAARELADAGVEVIVADSRQAAVDAAALRARWIIVDGLLQARPERLHRSLLVVDAAEPWGSHLCPPAGDLRAPRADLLAATDAVVVVGDDARRHPRSAAALDCGGVPAAFAPAVLQCARTADGRRVALSDLASQPVGLVLAVARPERIVRSLAAAGISPRVLWRFPDHAYPTSSELERARRKLGVGGPAPSAWLTSGKCASKLPTSIGGAPVLVMAHAITPPPALISWLCSDCASAPFPDATAVVDCAPCELPAGN